MKVSMTEKKSSYLLGSLHLLFSSCCCIAFVGFSLYFRLWGNALWSGPGVVGTAAGGVQVLLSWWDQQNLRWSLKQTVPLTTEEEKKPHHCDLWEIPPWPDLWCGVSLWRAQSCVFTVSDEHNGKQVRGLFSKNNPFGGGKTSFSSNVWMLHIHTACGRQLRKSLPQRTCCLHLLLWCEQQSENT